mgnify:CR=1 FL=1|tara:strand:+ start:15 stop:686 length:672 start_codon:yes stop_codon:yes gene_type:complete
MATYYNPKIVTDNLVLYLDAANAKSYPGSGTAWNNLAPSATNIGNATLKTSSGLNTYSGNNGGYFNTPRAFVPNPGGGSFSTFTYSVWCYPTTLSSYKSIIDQDNDDWLLCFLNTSIMIYDPSVTVPSFTASTNNWYNIVVTHTHEGPITFYINGKHEYTSTSDYSNAPDVTNWSIGGGSVSSGNDGNEVFAGHISNISIYNREITSSEVTQNFNALRNRFGV